jgi:SAM-dependent methyltransferase
MTSDAERERLRQTFDRASRAYHRARPDYPDELIDHLVAVTRLAGDARLLEIGCATGKATLALARRGLRITSVELGPELAAVARQNLAAFAEVTILEGSLEAWPLPLGDQFDLVFAATAWRWLDPAVRYRRAWEVPRPGGHLAFWDATHVFPEGGDPFFIGLQDVYDEIGEGFPPGYSWPRPGELPARRSEIEAEGLFEVVDVATSTGRRSTTPRATSISSGPSLATSPWRAGSVTVSTMRSEPA